MANVDTELEKLLEDLDAARRRLETRIPLIEEALEELANTDSVRLENYLGFGRSLRINEAVREALKEAATEEVTDLEAEVEGLREKVILRRTALAGLPQA